MTREGRIAGEDTGPASLAFHRTTWADLPTIQQWLRRPHVARYWAHQTDDAAIARDFGGSIDGTEPCADYMVVCAGVPIGFIQRSRISDYPEELRELTELVPVPQECLMIDYLLGDPDWLGRGLGTEMVRAFTELCWLEVPDAGEIIVAVSANNVASFSALSSAGYTRIASGRLTPDNPGDDGWHHVYQRLRP
ncbi:GNAT family N-acetyltransferase [Nesterenkonia sp. Act20]|uniref:GNAT family N-acetyltransferase n=1 Tax=Nesterenkonia sp. Act20 TaxID=1483432 RepID=UPI001C44B635|nr:GNAT family N-acetyltransferase [Nesterenkonia sp. Act20]